MIIVSVFLFHAVLRLKLENIIMGGWSKAGVYFGIILKTMTHLICPHLAFDVQSNF